MTDSGEQGAELYLGLMSGTSLDGVDAALIEITGPTVHLIASHYRPYASVLRDRLLALHQPNDNELHLAALAANELAELYAASVNELLDSTHIAPKAVSAIGCHGQTIRHRPDAGYTLQIGNAALLAELTGIRVVADFRSRDIAAGGQGAPLVPAFHAKVLHRHDVHRVIANIGGIANLTDLPITGPVQGFDCGPGNMLLDAWIHRCLGKRHDDRGDWAASGNVLPELLHTLLGHPFFHSAAPKSAGREQFNLHWLGQYLDGTEPSADVQATLLELTARTLVEAAKRDCNGYQEMYLCGGGVHNVMLIDRIAQLAAPARVESTAKLGVDPDWMEAMAFAWLAQQCLHRHPASLPEVTGAKGPRILGAIYSA
ncbi:MAG: anhydro-N-acetylmuramic acid kinase [Thiobacillaceae bacterium]